MVLLFFQIRYQLLSFDENLISDTLGLLFPASVIGFIIGIVTPPFFVHYYNRILTFLIANLMSRSLTSFFIFQNLLLVSHVCHRVHCDESLRIKIIDVIHEFLILIFIYDRNDLVSFI